MLNKISYYLDLSIQLLFIYGFGVILPLFFQDRYFDMLEAKYICFKVIGFILVTSITTSLFLKIVTKQFKLKVDLMKVSILLFLVSCTISTFLSYVPAYSFDGSQGFYIGLLTVSIIAISILYISTLKPLKPVFYLPVLVCCVVIYSITILHSMEIDVLDMHNNILTAAYHKYLSTIGNINWFNGYICLSAILFITLYLLKGKIIYLISSIFALSNILLIGSDGLYIGIAFCLCALFFIIFSGKDTLKHTIVLLTVLITEVIIIKYVPLFTNHLESMEGFCRLVFNKYMIITLIGLLLFLLLIYLKLDTKFYKPLAILCSLSLFISIIAVFAYTMNNDGNYFGNNRMFIWKRSFDVYFNQYSLKEKLFGTGLEMCRNLYQLLSSFTGQIITTSHSEPIQLLVTTGLAGYLSYLIFIGSYIFTFIQQKAYKNPLKTAISIALLAYFGQSLTVSTTIPNLAFMAILITLFMQKEKDSF